MERADGQHDARGEAHEDGKINLDLTSPPVEDEGLSGKRILELFRKLDKDGDGLITMAEFQVSLPALGFRGPKEVIRDFFRALDGMDGNGRIEYDQFSTWLHRSETEADRKTKALQNWRVTGQDAEEIRVEIGEMMQRDGINVTDMFAAWDKDVDAKMRKREWLVAMKKMVADEALWRSEMRNLAEEIWTKLKKDDQGKVGIFQFSKWLAGGDDVRKLHQVRPPSASQPQSRPDSPPTAGKDEGSRGNSPPRGSNDEGEAAAAAGTTPPKGPSRRSSSSLVSPVRRTSSCALLHKADRYSGTPTSSMLWPLGPVFTYGPSRNVVAQPFGLKRPPSTSWSKVRGGNPVVMRARAYTSRLTSAYPPLVLLLALGGLRGWRAPHAAHSPILA